MSGVAADVGMEVGTGTAVAVSAWLGVGLAGSAGVRVKVGAPAALGTGAVRSGPPVAGEAEGIAEGTDGDAVQPARKRTQKRKIKIFLFCVTPWSRFALPKGSNFTCISAR